MSGARHKLARSAGLISAATMLSRLLGLAREQLFAALMGASLLADAFNVAFRIPNLLRDLFAEGALSQAFVPTFKAALKHDGQSGAYQLANRVAGTLVVIVGVIVLLGAVFADHIVSFIAAGYGDVPGKLELTTLLTRVMMPFLLLISLSSVAMGMLNAQDRFGPPALAPAMFNVGSIAVGAGLYAFGVEGRWVVVGWSLGTLLGGASQLGVQLPPLWRTGFRPRLRADVRFRDPGVRRIARLMAPAIVGLAAVQVNVFVNTWFASTEQGAVSWLNYAFRFMQLPIGVFGVAIATVAMTRYSDSAADSDHDAMARQMTDGLRLVAFLTVPATVGLFVLGEPIIRLIYQRGAFAASDTVATVAALEMFIVGLIAYAGVKVVAPAFYALDRARVPMIASVLAVATNVTMNALLHPIYGYRILALGTAAAALLNFAILVVSFQVRVRRLANLELLGQLLRVAAAAAVMGAAVWFGYRGLSDLVGEGSLGPRLLVVFAPIAGGGLLYALLCKALRVGEVDAFTKRLRRRRTD